jgi:hypothetical protein
MHRILIWLEIQRAGYPANLKAGYRISGRIFYSVIKKCEILVNKEARSFFPIFKHGIVFSRVVDPDPDSMTCVDPDPDPWARKVKKKMHFSLNF